MAESLLSNIKLPEVTAVLSSAHLCAVLNSVNVCVPYVFMGRLCTGCLLLDGVSWTCECLDGTPAVYNVMFERGSRLWESVFGAIQYLHCGSSCY